MNTRPIPQSPSLSHGFSSALRLLATNTMLALVAFQASASNAQEPSKIADPIGASRSSADNTENSTPEATTIVRQARIAVIPIRVQHAHVVLVKDGDYVTPGTKLVEYDESVLFESTLKRKRAELVYEDNLKSHERHTKLRENNAISEEEHQKSRLATELSRIDYLLYNSALQELLLVTPKFPGTVRLNNEALNPVITIREEFDSPRISQQLPKSEPLITLPLEPHSSASELNNLEAKK